MIVTRMVGYSVITLLPIVTILGKIKEFFSNNLLELVKKVLKMRVLTFFLQREPY